MAAEHVAAHAAKAALQAELAATAERLREARESAMGEELKVQRRHCCCARRPRALRSRQSAPPPAARPLYRSG